MYTKLSIKLCLTAATVTFLKGIVSDSNNIFLWYESEDMNKKAYFQNFSWFQFYVFKLYMIIMCFIAHRLLSWIKSRVQDFLWKLLSFHTDMISA